MKKRHKKEKHVEAQTTSSEQHHESGSGDGVQPNIIEEHAPVDSREGENCFPPKIFVSCQNSLNALPEHLSILNFCILLVSTLRHVLN